MENKNNCTIFKNIFAKEAHYISVDTALDRIKNEKSKEKIESIRNQIDKERASKMKQNLPSVCFSGTFDERKDSALKEHSGYIVLDFDGIEEPEEYREELKEHRFIYSAWVSPSGNGVKALVRIAKGDNHQSHFDALMEDFDNLDASGRNVSRVCYESYDPGLWINKKAIQYRKLKSVEKVKVEEVVGDKSEVFEAIKKWLANKGDAFRTGERNSFIFKLASACCRFGLDDSECENFASMSFNDSTFSAQEMHRTIQSAYRANADSFNTAEFTNGKLVDKISKGEVETKQIDASIFDIDIKPKDVVFGEDVKGSALGILRDGYEQVDGIGIPELDYHFKFKRGEGTLLTGIGNYGKSSLWKWWLMMRTLKFGDKWALFSPEDNPAQEFYHDLVEIYLGKQCTPDNPNKPSEDEYNRAYDFVSEHFFYVYPESATPTPAYIKERFLELIIKENVDGVVVDPLNLLTHDYSAHGGRDDKYLEWLLTDFNRFAQINNVYYTVVAHPRLMKKGDDGNYPAPDVFDLSGGAMFNNKLDNILVYHRPHAQTDPQNSECEFHTKKIRRQKIVGKKGFIVFNMNFMKRRFIFGGRDYMEELITGEISKPAPIQSINYSSSSDLKEAAEDNDEWLQDEITFDGADM
jgi:hypothetical protein